MADFEDHVVIILDSFSLFSFPFSLRQSLHLLIRTTQISNKAVLSTMMLILRRRQQCSPSPSNESSSVGISERPAMVWGKP